MAIRALAGHAAPRIVRNLRRLRKLVPARAQAAVVSTLYNRWTTDNRMRSLRVGRNLCLLGCACPQSDDIKHYLRCPQFRGWADTRLGLRLPDATHLDTWMLAEKRMDPLRLRQVSVAVYVLYRTVNHLRHAAPPDNTTETYRRHYMNQLLHEATRGDLRLRRALQVNRAPAGAARTNGEPPRQGVRRPRDPGGPVRRVVHRAR